MEQRRSGFGQGFARDVEAILVSHERGHLYDHEVRANLRIAGMHLDQHIELPEFDFPVPGQPDETEPVELNDEEEETDG